MERILLMSMILFSWTFQAQVMENDCPTVDSAEQMFCQSQGTGNDYYQPTIAHLQVNATEDGVVWYDTPTSTDALDPDEILVDGEDYYAGNAAGTCEERAQITVIVHTSPNAGQTTFVNVCSNGGSVDLFEHLNPSMLGDAEPGGTMDPPLASGNTMFDPATDAPGQYRYWVDSPNEFCEDDYAVIYVSMTEAAEAGEDAEITLNVQSDPVDLAELVGATPDAESSWSPALASGTSWFDPSIDGPGEYTLTVFNDPNCEDDIATVTVNVTGPSDDPAGQNCPGVELAQQIFCESEGTGNDYYRPSIARLEATAVNGDDVVWYDTATSDEPLASDELLVDGENYFAGNASGTCTERVEVAVTVNPAPNAGATTFVTFCSNAGEVDILDYTKASVLGAAQPGGTIIPPFASGTTTFDPSIDTAGTYQYHVESLNDLCPDDKAVIYISVSEAASAGEDGEIGIFQDQGPVDLFDALGGEPAANGTWSPALESGTGVFDPSTDAFGTYTYTVNNDEGCESSSAEVTVYMRASDDPAGDCPVVEAAEQSFCQSEGSGNDYYRPAVAHLTATANEGEVVWYDTATSDQPLSSDELLVDGEDYFAGNASGTCNARPVVVVDLRETPNAGGTTFYTVNSDDEPFDLLDIYEPSILGPPQAGGTVEPPLVSGTTIFDPSQDSAGQYKYTVASPNGICPDDSSFIVVTINAVDQDEETIADANTSEGVALYPNPSKGDLNFTLEKGLKIQSVRIFDMNGNTVRSLRMDGKSNLGNMDISSLVPALYFAEIETDKGIFVKRILKE